MKKTLVILFLLGSCFLYAQTREDISIHIPMPLGGTTQEQVFFQENFTMETMAAGYTTTDDKGKSDYILQLEIKPNMILYDDGEGGVVEDFPEPEDKQFVVELVLIRNEDSTEIVSFSFAYTEVEEMYDFNLYLLYNAMANVPMTKLTSAAEDDAWRNKWLYLRAGADFNFPVYDQNMDKGYPESWKWSNNLTPPGKESSGQFRETPYMPGATIGLELQFLNWMSVEADFKFLFGDPEESSFVPTVGFALKFPLKPSKHFMLEPYAAVDFPMFTGTYIKDAPLFGLGGGFQFGVRGGSMGAIFIDVGIMYDIGDVHTLKTEVREIYWKRWVIGFGVGYKVGFVNRPEAKVAEPTTSP